MNTPDIIIFVCNLVLFPSIIPMILTPISHKPPLLTSIPTTLALFVIFLTFLHISLVFSAIMSLLNTIAWATLTIQRIKYLKISR